MSEFINTVDVLGDEVLTNLLIERKITEYKDNIVKRIGDYAFYSCYDLTIIDTPNVTSIGVSTVYACNKLKALILRSLTMCDPADNFPLSGSAINSRNGYVYVPRELVESYKSASKWSRYANQFRALEDYTVDGTITGELDESKI